MRRVMTGAVMMLALMAAYGCQSADSDETVDANDIVDVSATPNPATAVTSTAGKTYRVVRGNNQPDDIYTYPYEVSWGMAVTINSKANDEDLDIDFPVKLTQTSEQLQQASGGVANPPTGGEDEHYECTITSASGSSYSAVNTTINMNFHCYYALPSGGKEALITVTFTFVEDDGTGQTFSRSYDLRVNP